MKGKILLVVGLGVGYVLGTRAGREKYDQMKATALKFWNDPRVQQRVDEAQDFVKEKAPNVAEFLADGAKTVVTKVPGTKAPVTKPATKPATTRSTTPKK
ncbi:MAG: YtxH domain-containing protein [Rhodoglobus sp.]